MEESVATSLIRGAVAGTAGELWLDLGAGSGLFTTALAKLMTRGTIIAVDKDTRAMNEIPGMISNVEIRKVSGDFSATLPDVRAHGILMANSLHFIKEKITFLKQLKAVLRANGILIVVEYDMKVPNQWVPYPIDFNSLVKLGGEAGYSEVKKLTTAPSRYQASGMYSAVLK
jgi:ubiquinone/menaquinone biosynthesis C-methylase UbiE